MTAACPACVAGPTQLDLTELPDAVQLSVPSMRCAACISTVENHLTGLRGVADARVNLSQKRVRVVTDRPASELAAALKDVGFEAYPLDANALSGEKDRTGHDLLMRLGVAGFAMMNVMLLSVAVWSGAEGATRDLFHLISATIALPVVLYSAQPFFKHAMQALRVGRLNMDVPISLAILLAGAMSLYESFNGGEHAYFDAALSLTFFLLIGRYLEHHTRSTARSAAKELAALETHTVSLKTPRGVETVPLTKVQVGDVALVQTGVRVPVDGVLISKEAHTDRAFLTGESDPVAHQQDALLNAGEINLGAPFEMRASAVGQDTRLHQIARLVETAENARNSYTSLADRAAQVYAPAVHLLALVTFIGWYAISQDLRHSLNIAIAVLIITCPCALGLAVPAVSTAAISKLYRLGFLVKSGTALERLAECRNIVLDKTGTLTTPGFSFAKDDFSDSDLSIAKALAQNSAHPLSKSLDLYLGEVRPAELDAISETKGGGVSANSDGVKVALGRASWLGGDGDALVLKIGETLHPVPYKETLKEGVQDMTGGLSAQNLALEIMSGDTPEKTAQVAAAAEVAEFTASMSPEEKSTRVTAMEAEGATPCMIGDGLNDTVALAAAHASIAPGSALDAARSAADVVVIGNTMAHVPKLFKIAHRAVALSRQNFAISLVYNLIAVPIAVLGYATPLAAALAMSLSSITVLLNAVRVGRIS
ncbi:MAG: heavy metal translocating P-type ATPase [Litoreibacter sp.]|nr:heavy metal translocating P-type ATPase [Litoreibacter sp.]